MPHKGRLLRRGADSKTKWLWYSDVFSSTASKHSADFLVMKVRQYTALDTEMIKYRGNHLTASTPFASQSIRNV